MFFKKKKDNQLSKYIDANDDFSNRELTLSMWFLNHKFLLRKIGIGMLISFCVLTVGYSILGFGYYLFVGYSQDRLQDQQLATFINYRNLQPLYTAVPIRLSDTDVYHVGGDRYDFVSIVNNDNDKYIANVSYHYRFGGNIITPIRISSVLPRESLLLVEYGFETVQFPSNLELIIDGVSWKRINPHRLEDPISYIDERLVFPIEDVNFVRASRLSGVETHRVNFDIVNDSVYSYWEPVFHVAFFNGQLRTGVFYLELDRILAGEVVSVDLRSFADQLDVTDVVVYPEIDVFDSEVYILPGEE